MFRREYGATPLHLALGLFSFALALFAVWQLSALPAFVRVLIWLAGAVLFHDFLLLPVYSAVARSGIKITRWSSEGRAPETEARAIDRMNHIRVPATISMILLLLFFPLIFGVVQDSFERTTGMGTEIYLGRWLAITAVLFAASALHYAVRHRRR